MGFSAGGGSAEAAHKELLTSTFEIQSIRYSSGISNIEHPISNDEGLFVQPQAGG
jgi:hypothetical protein